MKTYQVFLMLVLTILVGALFVFGIPQNESTQVATLSAMVTMQQQTIQYLQQQPTIPTSPTPAAETPTPDTVVQQVPVATTGSNFVPTPLVTYPPFPTEQFQQQQQVQQQQSGITSGSRIVNVQTALSVTSDGCVSSPQSSFSPADTIYGVVLVADTQVGDQLSVSFNYDTGGILIYEDSFTIRDPGGFCRWYTVEPDSLGWESGSYTVSYQLNDTAPVTSTYSINLSGGGDVPADDAMSEDDAMMEEGQ